MKQSRVMHLIPNDKFFNNAVDLFESVSCVSNVFYKQNYRAGQEKTEHDIKVKNVVSSRFIKEIKSCEAVILHSLNTFNLLALFVIILSGYRGKVAWIGMGYDYYDIISRGGFPYIYNRLTGSCLVRCKRKRLVMIKDFLLDKLKVKDFLVKRVDFFCPVLRSEYDMVKNIMGERLTASFLSWRYSISSQIIDFGDSAKSDDNIRVMIGNSATPSNNHLDIFKVLENHQSIKEVIIPLSYGSPKYARDMLKALGNGFNYKITPLFSYMNYKAYSEVVGSCSHVIMGHVRQQAMGNVITALYLGAKVALDHRNPMYQHFLSEGFFIYTLEDASCPDFFICGLEEKKVKINRSIIKKNYSKKVAVENSKDLIFSLTS